MLCGAKSLQAQRALHIVLQVAEQLQDRVRILKVDCDKNEDLSNSLQIQGLPTLIFIGTDASKPALRTEGLLPASVIVEIVEKELEGGEADASSA
jgi:thioredoxin-like negative regulator of GroEL